MFDVLLLGSIGSLDGPARWDCSIGVGYEICGLDMSLLHSLSSSSDVDVLNSDLNSS